MLMVLRDRADIALITRSNLADMFRRHPQVRHKVMVSRRIDQTYHHYALLRPQSPIQAPQFAQLLQALRENGQLDSIFDPYNIEVESVAGAP